MANPPVAGVPFCAANLQEHEWYIRVGKEVFSLAYCSDKDVPVEVEQICV